MTGSIAIDVVIGLIFIYLLYSLLATIVQEAIANTFSFRAKFLQKAIIRMLEDGNAKAANGFWSNLASFFSIFSSKKNINHLPLTKAFYSHSLIKYLAEDDYHDKPSYLTAQNFSKTILDLLKGGNFAAGKDPRPFIEQALKDKKIKHVYYKHGTGSSKIKVTKTVVINNDTIGYLRSIWADSQGDVAKFTLFVEDWFNITMERTTGWYKKQTPGVLFMIGLTIAVLFNVDTIMIADKLVKEPILREQIVKQADNYLKENPNATQQNNDSLRKVVGKNIEEASHTLALGWACKCDDKLCKGVCIESNMNAKSPVGWLLTAFALSLGAPFWFDLLNKFMKLRGAVNSGNKDDKSDQSTDQKKINAKG